jgi:hypothetical protein
VINAEVKDPQAINLTFSLISINFGSKTGLSEPFPSCPDEPLPQEKTCPSSLKKCEIFFNKPVKAKACPCPQASCLTFLSWKKLINCGVSDFFVELFPNLPSPLEPKL